MSARVIIETDKQGHRRHFRDQTRAQSAEICMPSPPPYPLTRRRSVSVRGPHTDAVCSSRAFTARPHFLFAAARDYPECGAIGSEEHAAEIPSVQEVSDGSKGMAERPSGRTFNARRRRG